MADDFREWWAATPKGHLSPTPDTKDGEQKIEVG